MVESVPAAPAAGHAEPVVVAVPPGRPGGFLVDADAAGKPVAMLEEALDRLAGTLIHLRRRFMMEPPAEDHVSRRIADNANLMVGNAHDYVLALHRRVEKARDALRAQLTDYAAADDPQVFRG